MPSAAWTTLPTSAMPVTSSTHLGQKSPFAPLASQTPMQMRLGVMKPGEPAADVLVPQDRLAPRRRLGQRREVGRERLELGHGLRPVGGLHAIAELVRVEPALGGGVAQPLGHRLALGVRGAVARLAHGESSDSGRFSGSGVSCGRRASVDSQDS